MAPYNILQSILIFTIVAIPTLILGGAYRALAETGNPSTRRSMLLLAPLLFGWLAVAIYLGSVGTFQR